ncbi:hypothetical protein SAMN04488528_100770 [Clostridium frigidicarnis]|uniref:Uncharacterized protein n=1 Tax=Clostridium frigidicarnis TaxID=84698 RepID=A0A1I0X4V0_9CLOT|nr:hypothetical protein SAMN04488528_100770 [Clostridium frigidicarnis]
MENVSKELLREYIKDQKLFRFGNQSTEYSF